MKRWNSNTHAIDNSDYGRPAKKMKLISSDGSGSHSHPTSYQNTIHKRRKTNLLSQKRNDGGMADMGIGLLGSILGGSDDNPITKVLESLTGGRNVHQEHNHIVFNDDVSMDTIRQLIDLINDANREYDRMHIDDTSNFIMPKPLYLHIASNGGDLFAGLLAYDAIKNSKIPIYTVVDAYAVSAGSIMFMAGQKRFMHPNSYILIHQLSETIYGSQTNSSAMDGAANNIELMERLYRIYLTEFKHNYSPVPSENILNKELLERHMAHDIYWNFQTCFKYGIADGIYTNYHAREEIDRHEFYQSMINGESTLPTYAEITGNFEREHCVLFDSNDEFKPSADMVSRISVLAQKQADTRNKVQTSLQGSALSRLLNQPESASLDSGKDCEIVGDASSDALPDNNPLKSILQGLVMAANDQIANEEGGEGGECNSGNEDNAERDDINDVRVINTQQVQVIEDDEDDEVEEVKPRINTRSSSRRRSKRLHNNSE
jgi:ATP-dependent Clp protease, protease subunit